MTTLGRLAPAAALAAALACAGARPRPEAAESPVEVTRAFYRALHARDAAAAAALVDGPRAREAADAFVRMSSAYASLEQALTARFGPGAAREVGYAERVAAEEDALRGARAEVGDDTATVFSEDDPLATLRRAGGRWRIALREALASGDGLSALAGEAAASAAAAERVAPAVRGGLFDSAGDAVEAFRSELEVAREGAPGAPDDAPAQAPPDGSEGSDAAAEGTADGADGSGAAADGTTAGL